MSIWSRGPSRDREVKRSGELRKELDKLEAKRPKVMQEWNKIDAEEVMPRAEALSVLLHSQNQARILETRQQLNQAIWKRDGLLEDFNRQVDAINCEIETLSGPVIYENIRRYQAELLGLRDRRRIEIDDKWRDLGGERNPKLYSLRTNFMALEAAREGLLAAIRTLRGMHRPLGEVLAYIHETDEKLSRIDLDSLKVGDPVSEAVYYDLIAEPGAQVLEQRSLGAPLLQ